MQLNRALVRFLWLAVIFLAFIGLVVVARRTIVLLHPGAPSTRNNPAAALDTHFADHRALTLTHILPAALFMILGPLQFVRRIRSRHPQFHRWSGRVFLTASAIVGADELDTYLKHSGRSRIDAWMTRRIFRYMLIKRAYTKHQFLRMAETSRFGACHIALSPIGFEVRFSKPVHIVATAS